MEAELCVRCGLPNEIFFNFLRAPKDKPPLIENTSEVNCIRCGLPNSRFVRYLADKIVSVPVN